MEEKNGYFLIAIQRAFFPEPWKIKQAPPDRAVGGFFINSWLRVDQGCDLAREAQGKGRLWVWMKLIEKTQLTLQMPHTVSFLKGSECQETLAGPCGHTSIFLFVSIKQIQITPWHCSCLSEKVYALWTSSNNYSWVEQADPLRGILVDTFYMGCPMP